MNYAGQTFYFLIVVKETNSDNVKYSYYASIEIEEAAKTAFSVQVDEDSMKGSLEFSDEISSQISDSVQDAGIASLFDF